jgi:hypothetical protein
MNVRDDRHSRLTSKERELFASLAEKFADTDVGLIAETVLQSASPSTSDSREDSEEAKS